MDLVSVATIYQFYRCDDCINKIDESIPGVLAGFVVQWVKGLQSVACMIENQKTPALDKKGEIEWTHYNYPPLLCIVHFSLDEVPQDRKFIVLSLFALHIASVALSLLNFIDNCIEGGLGILYSLLYSFIFVPLLLLVFYKGVTGVCRPSKSLKMFLILQPIAIVLEIVGSIVDFLGFNGFMRVSEMYKAERAGAATLGLIVALLYLAMGLYSAFIYVKILRERKDLKVV